MGTSTYQLSNSLTLKDCIVYSCHDNYHCYKVNHINLHFVTYSVYVVHIITILKYKRKVMSILNLSRVIVQVKVVLKRIGPDIATISAI